MENAGARVVVRFRHYVFHSSRSTARGGSLLFLDFGVIGQHTDGMKILSATAFVCAKKKRFLHCVRRVRAIVQDLVSVEWRAANPRQTNRRSVAPFRQGVTLLAESVDLHEAPRPLCLSALSLSVAD